MEVCTTKQTAKLKRFKRLFKTNNCPGCNLGDADLSRVNLGGADLSEAELRKAVLDGAKQKANLSKWLNITIIHSFQKFYNPTDKGMILIPSKQR